MTDETADPTTAALAEIAALRQRLTDLEARRPPREPTGPPVIRPTATAAVFYRSDLRDPAFYQAHKAEILAAVRRGGVIDDRPGWRTNSRESEAARAAARTELGQSLRKAKS